MLFIEVKKVSSLPLANDASICINSRISISTCLSFQLNVGSYVRIVLINLRARIFFNFLTILRPLIWHIKFFVNFFLSSWVMIFGAFFSQIKPLNCTQCFKLFKFSNSNSFSNSSFYILLISIMFSWRLMSPNVKLMFFKNLWLQKTWSMLLCYFLIVPISIFFHDFI